jgi:hypothetical protein
LLIRRRLPRIGDTVFVGTHLPAAEWRRGRVVLAVNTTTEEMVYLVRLEVPQSNGARTVKARATEIMILPEF